MGLISIDIDVKLNYTTVKEQKAIKIPQDNIGSSLNGIAAAKAAVNGVYPSTKPEDKHIILENEREIDRNEKAPRTALGPRHDAGPRGL